MGIDEKKLRVFASWCKSYEEYYDSYSTGQLERAIISCREETIKQIGDMLDEILHSDNLDLDEEIKNAKFDYPIIVYEVSVPK